MKLQLAIFVPATLLLLLFGTWPAWRPAGPFMPVLQSKWPWTGCHGHGCYSVFTLEANGTYTAQLTNLITRRGAALVGTLQQRDTCLVVTVTQSTCTNVPLPIDIPARLVRGQGSQLDLVDRGDGRLDSFLQKEAE